MQTNLGKGGYVDSIETINHDAEIQAIYGFETPLAGSLLSLNTGIFFFYSRINLKASRSYDLKLQ